MNKVRVSKIRDIVSSMTNKEVAKEIKDLEGILTTQNTIIEYNLENDIAITNYIYKVNAIADIVQAFRIAAYEQGKLEGENVCIR